MKNWSLFARTFLVYLALLASAILVITLSSNLRSARSYRESYVIRARILLGGLRDSTARLVRENDLSAAAAQFEAVESLDPDLRDVRIRGDWPFADSVHESNGFRMTWYDGELHAAMPLEEGGGNGRLIYLRYSLSSLRTVLRRSRWEAFGWATVAALLGGIIAYVQSRYSSAAFVRIIAATRRVGKGEGVRPLPVDGDDELGRLSKAFNGMMERLASTLAELEESRLRFQLAVQGSQDGIWDWDMDADRMYYSERWAAMIGHAAADLGTDRSAWFDRIHPDDSADVDRRLKDHIFGRTEYFRAEYRLRHADGTYRWVATRGLAVRDADGRANRMAGSQTDITDRKDIEQRLTQTALYDPLTGLPNRALLTDRLNHSVHVAERKEDYEFAVLFLDFDGFKHVNDTYGHAVGDLLLVSIAKRLRAAVRPSDTVARIGGDEFVILLEGVAGEDVVLPVCDRILDESAREFEVDGQSIFVTVSIGIAHSSTDFESVDDLVQNADVAMYHAKMEGRGQWRVFDNEMRTALKFQWQRSNELHKAIERDELSLRYQPIHRSDGSIYGFEALLRWHHGEHGNIPPDVFIRSAEETGYVTELTRWVLANASRQVAEWNRDYRVGLAPLVVGVNLSSKDFLATGGVGRIVREAVEETGIAPEALKVEVTESSLMQDLDKAVAQLGTVRGMGIGVDLDDFGTGYSSLSYLHKFPIGGLKIDQSFIKSMDPYDPGSRIVKTIITMAHDLGLSVVAEGVETVDHLTTLLDWGCDLIQGYHYSRPLAKDEVVVYLGGHTGR